MQNFHTIWQFISSWNMFWKLYTIWSKVTRHPSVVVNWSLDVTTTALTSIKGGRKLCCSLLNSTSSMRRSGELSDFERGLVIGCHICKKSLRDIATLLKLPKSMAGDVIVKWKREGKTTMKPRLGRAHLMTNRGCRALIVVCATRWHQVKQSPVSSASYELSSQHPDCVESYEEWGSMGEQLPINQIFCLWTIRTA
jgi:hypothetical protein